MTHSFALDKSNAMILGVCSGIANWTGLDRVGVRLIALALTFFLLGPVALLAYFLTALIADHN
jgi:phage shock protein C